jgi:hypothetical protein
MGRNTATINYGIGSLFGNAFNMYLFGSGILTGIQFIIGLAQTESLDGALNVALNYYIAKLTPFPLDEFLTAGGFEEVALNITMALGLGLLIGMYRYRKNRF